MMKASNQSNGQSTKELEELNERISELETAEAELARIVDSLRESKDQYRTLFESMHEGFAPHEIVCDEQGNSFNYRLLEVDSPFGEFTGLKRVTRDLS